ncbi:glucosamine-6-phosphate deaminase [Vagococcus sp. BWB3-3]|uniref:Glucosamine-6-phosphate deaminase n=1 Tax=Vagococcus allomyrinae TaxID=2794353 RepID=A0A940PGB9_9ENTE|nr:glucosamine-6-phosphate deaminase [Vagococcus allomyrinae]MBP1044349.1 glucosamine-6-phosphate deaminase [Vagococcus allomyrinae]
MRVIVTENYEELGKVASQHLLGHLFSKQDRVNLAITAGTTPVEVYRYLIPEVKGKAYLSHAHFYNFDEIPYKESQREGITMSDLRELFFKPAAIPETSIHVLDGQNYQGQDQRIHQAGGLDGVLLGIGADGHYCGNLPGTTTIDDQTTKVICDDQMKARIGRHFEEAADVPDYYVTMGPKSIMAARHLILIANGKRKADIMRKFLEEEISLALPATILKLHPNLTVIMDREAASDLTKSDELGSN